MRDALGAVQSVLVLGGGSDIARAAVRRLSEDGRCRTVVLAGRDPGRLGPVATDLRDHGVETVDVVAFDANAPETHQAVIDEVWLHHPDIDVVLLAFGVLGDQATFDDDPAWAAAAATTNYAGAVSAGLAVAAHLRAQAHGTLVVFSSVAGERVRADNFVYGSTKAGLDGFAQGLGDRLVVARVAPADVRRRPRDGGVAVLDVSFAVLAVRTPMTEGMDDKSFATTADAVANDVVAGLRRGAHTVWSPPQLRWVFSVMRHLPRPLWRLVAARG